MEITEIIPEIIETVIIITEIIEIVEIIEIIEMIDKGIVIMIGKGTEVHQIIIITAVEEINDILTQTITTTMVIRIIVVIETIITLIATQTPTKKSHLLKNNNKIIPITTTARIFLHQQIIQISLIKLKIPTTILLIIQSLSKRLKKITSKEIVHPCP